MWDSFFFLQSKRSQKVSTQRISTNLFANSEVLHKQSCYFLAKTSRGPKGRTPGTKKRQPKTVDDSDAEDPSPMPFKTPRSVARPPKAGKEKSTNQKRRKMPSFESDEDDSIELFDVGEEEEDCQRGIDWNDEENVNPNVTNKNKANDAISKKGRINSQRKSNRRRVSSTWQAYLSNRL